MSAKKTLLIFTGAGFSKALNKKFPTTADIYNKLKSNKNNEIRNLNYFEGYFQTKIPDIEVLAKMISNHSKQTRQLASKLSGLLKYLSKLDDYSGNHRNFPISINSITAMRDHAKSLNTDWDESLQYIHKQILQLLFQIPVKQKAQTSSKIFIKELKEHCDELNIFSTNYDKAIRLIQDDTRYYLGDDNAVNLDKIIDAKWNKNGYCYIPLKGMLDWRLAPGSKEIFQTPEKDKTIATIQDSAVMALQNTSGFQKLPHRHLYETFQKKLAEAEYLLFIGYSFRDAAINDAIVKMINLAKIKSIVIVHQELGKTQQEREKKERSFKKRIQKDIFLKRQKNIFFISDGLQLYETDKKLQNTDTILSKLFDAFRIHGYAFSYSIERKSGVYIVATRNSVGEQEILYVDESEDVEQGLANHEELLRNTVGHLSDRFHYLACYCNQATRKKIKSEIKKIHDPVHNKQYSPEEDKYNTTAIPIAIKTILSAVKDNGQPVFKEILIDSQQSADLNSVTIRSADVEGQQLTNFPGVIIARAGMESRGDSAATYQKIYKFSISCYIEDDGSLSWDNDAPWEQNAWFYEIIPSTLEKSENLGNSAWRVIPVSQVGRKSVVINHKSYYRLSMQVSIELLHAAT